MNNFISKMFLFLFLFLLLSKGISYKVPYHFGNRKYSTKIKYLEENKNNTFNTYFLGSSRIYRQLNPDIFDSTYYSITNNRMASFNLGVDQLFYPQNYYLYENFLNSKLSLNTEYYFIELSNVHFIKPHLMHQVKFIYWLNLSELKFVLKTILKHPHLDYRRVIKLFFRYIISYLENIFYIGHFQELIMGKYYNKKFIGPYNNGYFPLQLELGDSEDLGFSTLLLNRKKELFENKKVLNERARSISQYHRKISKKYDSLHYERINYLITQSKQKGIHLVFILPPMVASKRLINLFYRIPRENAIDLSNPDKFNQFYTFENSFDINHLNKKGASELSKILAKEFSELMYSISL